ncbi:hypothetical protein [Lacticaseibacillus saniviri]
MSIFYLAAQLSNGVSWQTWIPIGISAISLLLSIATGIFTFVTFRRSQPNIRVFQSRKNQTAVVIEPEWNDDIEFSPDRYVDRRYRILLEITITNRSSNPISISSFVLNDEFDFGAYSNPGSRYTIKQESSESVVNGITYLGREKIAGFSIEDQWIKPVVEIKPFGILKGYLFWPIYEDDLPKIKIGGLNRLTMETTFKRIETEVYIDELIKRDPSLKRRPAWTNKSTI